VSFFGGERILATLYTPEYARHSNVLVLSCFFSVASFASSAVGYGLTAARVFFRQSLVFGVALLSCIAASAYLIPRYELVGAALAVGFAALVQAIGCAAILIRTVCTITHSRRTSNGIAS
jgi:O-antigen/teichoic acid export membrane protein